MILKVKQFIHCTWGCNPGLADSCSVFRLTVAYFVPEKILLLLLLLLLLINIPSLYPGTSVYLGPGFSLKLYSTHHS